MKKKKSKNFKFIPVELISFYDIIKAVKTLGCNENELRNSIAILAKSLDKNYFTKR